MRTIMIVKRLSYVLVLVLCSHCFADYCPHRYCHSSHVWSNCSGISDITFVKKHSQSWHDVGRPTMVRAVAEDPDYTYCPVEPSHTGTVLDSLTYSWTSSKDYIVGATTYHYITWCATSYTPEPGDKISVTVDDVASMHVCDTGDRDDNPKTRDDLYLGAWQTIATVVASGTNNPVPIELVAYETEYYDYNDYEPTGAPMKETSPISLNSNHISLGNYNDETVISPNPGSVTLSPAVTSEATWTISCVPDDAWSADVQGTAYCYADRIIDGDIISKVWDDDADFSGLDVSVGVTFGAPISITIAADFDLENDNARSQVAMGFGWQGDLAFQTGYHGKIEHADDSNAHSYSGTTPYTKTTSIDSGSYLKIIGGDVKNPGSLSAEMKTQTEGWTQGKESQELAYPIGYIYYDMYGEIWQEGTIKYKVGAPSYGGTPHNNPNW
jgi:hypothetical protein